MDSIEHVIQAYGFLGAFFVLVCIASAYILKRFLNKEDGILTLVMKKHIVFIDKTIDTMHHITKTQEAILCSLASLVRIGRSDKNE